MTDMKNNLKIFTILTICVAIGCTPRIIKWNNNEHPFSNKDEAECQMEKRKAMSSYGVGNFAGSLMILENAQEVYMFCMQSKGYIQINK